MGLGFTIQGRVHGLPFGAWGLSDSSAREIKEHALHHSHNRIPGILGTTKVY